ncbi:MAG: RsmE family RNA methyltransferase [Akkermansia sp.]
MRFVHLTLCQAVPKGANMDLIIQKSVELGVSAIVPLLTDRTIVRLNAREAEAKRQKWQRIALEACKQCGQNTLPKVALPVPFAEWLRGGIPEGLNIIASLAPGVRPVREVLEAARSRSVRHASLLVGPEGDFTDRETAALEAGFSPLLWPHRPPGGDGRFFGLAAMRYALD